MHPQFRIILGSLVYLPPQLGTGLGPVVRNKDIGDGVWGEGQGFAQNLGSFRDGDAGL